MDAPLIACPVEVVDFILNLAAAGDRHALGRLRLVDKAICTIVSGAFFAHITYPSRTPFDDIAFLESHQHVTAAVRSIKFEANTNTDDCLKVVGLCNTGKLLLEVEWGFACHMEPSPLFAEMTFQKSVIVSSLDFSTRTLSWLLSEGYKIKALKLISWTSYDTDHYAYAQDPPGCQLREFAYCCDTPVKARLFRNTYLFDYVLQSCVALTVLDLHAYPTECGHVQRMLDNCAPTLTVFHLQLLDESLFNFRTASCMAPPLQLQSLSALRRLAFSADGYDADFVAGCVSSVAPDATLHKLHLDFVFGISNIKWHIIRQGLQRLRRSRHVLQIVLEEQFVTAPSAWLDWMADGVFRERFQATHIFHLELTWSWSGN